MSSLPFPETPGYAESSPGTLPLRSDAFASARRRVLRSLLESMLYERIISAEPEPTLCEQLLRVSGQDESGAAVQYVFRALRRPSFDRVRITSNVERVAGADRREATSIARFMLETRGLHRASPELLTQFIEELEQTVLKHAQSLADAEQALASSAPAPAYDQLETQVGDGHPYHPSFKSRVGFSLADNRMYGPEFGPSLRPIWLGLSGEGAARAASRTLDLSKFLVAELGEQTLAQFTHEIVRAGQDPETCVLLPVHPWQWLNRIQPIFQEELQAGSIVYLGASADSYRPQQSIRTLVNLTTPGKAALKHALSIVNTSTTRILASHTVLNAPIISDWLTELAQEDEVLRELRTILLREVLGATYESPCHALLRTRSYGVLSCIWRESLHTRLESLEQAIPWTALTWLQPDGTPYIAPWWARDGERFLERVLDVSVLPLLHLLVHHGIALESHAQNMHLVHVDGVPKRVALKDFHDGVRFSPGRLARPELAPALRPMPAHHVRVNRNSFLTSERAEAVRDFLFDAFFFVNLGELALFLADHFAFPEARFWSLVRARFDEYEDRLASGRAQRILTADLRPRLMEVEKLTSRRLFPESDCQTHFIPCPWRME